MIFSIVHARLLHFYPPKSLPLTLQCYYFKAYVDEFRGLCPPATYLDTPGLASDVSYTGEISPNHAVRDNGFSQLYSRFVLKDITRPVNIDLGESVCKFCTTLSLSTNVSPSNTVSWLVIRKRTFELTRAWMAMRVSRRRRTAATDIKRKRDSNDEIQCLNNKSSSEDNIYTMWTDESKNFGLRVKIEGRVGLLTEEELTRLNRDKPPARYNIHIRGV